VTSQQDNMTK